MVPNHIRQQIRDKYWNSPNVTHTELAKEYNISRPTVAKIVWEDPSKDKQTRICTYPKCTNKHHATGYCNLHKMRLKRTGQLEIIQKRTTPEQHKQIIKLYTNNILSMREIGRRMSISHHTVRNILKKHNIIKS